MPMITTPQNTPYERLRPRHKAWLDHFVTDAAFNATKAAELAGFGHPREAGSKLKRRYGHLVDSRVLALRDSLSMTAKEVVEGLTVVARDSQHKDHVRALELLAKVHGLLSDRLDIKIDRKQIAQEVETALLKLTAIPTKVTPMLPMSSEESDPQP